MKNKNIQFIPIIGFIWVIFCTPKDSYWGDITLKNNSHKLGNKDEYYLNAMIQAISFTLLIIYLI